MSTQQQKALYHLERAVKIILKHAPKAPKDEWLRLTVLVKENALGVVMVDDIRLTTNL